MDKTEKASAWRGYFERSDSEFKTYKLFVETAYGCAGSCQGCPVPKEMRASTEPKWQLDKLDDTLSRFAENLVEFKRIRNHPPIENLAVTAGPAENLFFSQDYLTGLAEVALKFKNSVGAENFHLAVSTSGLFSESRVAEKIGAMKKVLSADGLAFAFIVNLRQFEKTPEHYFNFAKTAFSETNLVELEINMDSDVGLISDSTIAKFAEFVDSFPFVQLEFAYAINDGNSVKTLIKDDSFVEFARKIRSAARSSKADFFSQWHEALNPVPSDDFDFVKNFNLCLEDVVGKSIRLNALGEWHFAKNALGTLYYDETFGFERLCVATENPFSQSSISKFKKNLLARFSELLESHKPCSDCSFRNVCLSSGFLSYAKFSDMDETTCGNPGLRIFMDKSK